jgi:hypothetical protein
MFARIGMMRTLNRRHVREFNPNRKDPLGQAQAEARSVTDLGQSAIFYHTFERAN